MNNTNLRVPDYHQARVLVIGDVMLDRYWSGNCHRVSPEAPVPIIHVQDLDERAGGAGNVALNLTALGAKTTLAGIVGDDREAEVLLDILANANVNLRVTKQANWSTVTKLRVLGRNQQLLRMDFEGPVDGLHLDSLYQQLEHLIAEHDVVILSDYGKGTLRRVQEIIQFARQQHKTVIIDPKSNDFSVYRGASLISPNMQEFQAVVGPCRDDADIVAKGQQLMQQQQIEALLITRSEKGMTLLRQSAPPLHLPTRAREVFDVTGAGDTVVAALAASLAAGIDLERSARLANFAAGIVVRKVGSATVSVPELRRALQRQFNSEVGVLSEAELLTALEDARAHGETIVMTNGCFDILHAGHITYLDQAKALGKRLIVAVNDDASVGRLKGPSRPINSLADRMTVLAGLRAVDWVVAFSEDTPARLIEAVAPDILVKGGDYEVTDIAGHETVLANGGEVKIIPFLPGHSTSGMIDAIFKRLPETT